MKQKFIDIACLLLILIVQSCQKENSSQNDIVLIKANGTITDEVNAFRHLLGDQLNTNTGAIGGRREINWDAVPDSLLGKDLPLDFFNPTAAGSPAARQRGLAYAGGRFQVSSDGFQEINSNASSEFQPFSGNKVFASVNSNAWEIVVEKPGQQIPASVQGFGMVFSDVDLSNSTSLEFFNGGKSLGKFFAPAHDSASSFSFLGVYFNSAERITRVRVQHDGILAGGEKDISASGTKDLVVLDDLLYSEPVAQNP